MWRNAYILCILVTFFSSNAALIEPLNAHGSEAPISSNPAAASLNGHSGNLGRTLGIREKSGVTLGGLWIGDVNIGNNSIFPGKKYRLSGNNLLLFDLLLDCEKSIGFCGSTFCLGFLRYDGQPTNVAAGTIQGYNNLPGLPPLHRSELYQLWYRQKLFDDTLTLRMGKMVLINDFNNVVRPILLQDEIILTTGLTYRPVFSNPTTFGVFPGYYNSAYGLIATAKPVPNFYCSGALYDGSLALTKVCPNGNFSRANQPGLHIGPLFKAFLGIAETGVSWHIGSEDKAGNASIGAWCQTGCLKADFGIIPSSATENGAQGAYAFGSQQLWNLYPGNNKVGIVGFWQLGINNSNVLPVNKYIGAGLSAVGLVPTEKFNICGIGIASSWNNTKIIPRAHEIMFQAYYETHLVGSSFLIGSLSYIPNPAFFKQISHSVAGTLRVLALF